MKKKPTQNKIIILHTKKILFTPAYFYRTEDENRRYFENQRLDVS